jgi:hypothetical protein
LIINILRDGETVEHKMQMQSNVVQQIVTTGCVRQAREYGQKERYVVRMNRGNGEWYQTVQDVSPCLCKINWVARAFDRES